MQKPKPYLLPRSEVCGHRDVRQSTAGPPLFLISPSLFRPPNPLIFIAFFTIFLHEADSAAILHFMLLYEADSDAMLPDFLLYEPDYAAILLL